MQFVIVDPVISGVPHLLDIGDAQRLERVLHRPLGAASPFLKRKWVHARKAGRDKQ